MALRFNGPETRQSLLDRLRSGADESAWSEFVDLYAPAIYRTARGLGLQDVDAQDVTQQVLVAVAKSLDQRPHDPQRAKFRTWMARVTRNASLNVRRRLLNDPSLGGSRYIKSLDEVAAVEDGPELDLFEREYQRELFQAAANAVQRDVAETTWQAFWLTTVVGVDIAVAAEQLGMNTGAVYAARSRIVRRLREWIEAQEI